MKRVLITGGGGFIGRNLHKRFYKDGWNVIAPTHSQLDLLDNESMKKFFHSHDCDPSHSSFDAVIHTANKGGRRGREDTFDDYLANIKMFENLIYWTPRYVPIIIYGSGAELDRRYYNYNTPETEVFKRWPIDPYGLSKNIITRRALTEYTNIHILRLFGCFHADEDDMRFIKRSILRLKKGLPIEINQNKYMDFFSLDDTFTVTKYVIENRHHYHVNLVYPQKLTLLDVASLIHKHTEIFDPVISLQKNGNDPVYTGSGEYLKKLGLPLEGLEMGIKRMVGALYV